MDEKLERWIERVHTDALLVSGAHEEFLVFVVLALLKNRALSVEDVAFALEGQQRFIENRLQLGEDVRLLGSLLEFLAGRIRDVAARAGFDVPPLRAWRNPPWPGWPRDER